MDRHRERTGTNAQDMSQNFIFTNGLGKPTLDEYQIQGCDEGSGKQVLMHEDDAKLEMLSSLSVGAP